MIAEECVQKLLDLPISNPPSERDALGKMGEAVG